MGEKMKKLKEIENIIFKHNKSVITLNVSQPNIPVKTKIFRWRKNVTNWSEVHDRIKKYSQIK